MLKNPKKVGKCAKMWKIPEKVGKCAKMWKNPDKFREIAVNVIYFMFHVLILAYTLNVLLMTDEHPLISVCIYTILYWHSTWSVEISQKWSILANFLKCSKIGHF